MEIYADARRYKCGSEENGFVQSFDWTQGSPRARDQYGYRNRLQRSLALRREGIAHVDTMLHDHKLSDPTRHKQWTGVDNSRILENFKRAYETFPDTRFIARTPLIPGVNDDEAHIRAVLAFIRPYKNVIDYELLPYHRFGESKYSFLGRVYEMEDFKSLTEESLAHLRGIIDEAFGRTAVRIG